MLRGILEKTGGVSWRGGCEQLDGRLAFEEGLEGWEEWVPLEGLV